MRLPGMRLIVDQHSPQRHFVQRPDCRAQQFGSGPVARRPGQARRSGCLAIEWPAPKRNLLREARSRSEGAAVPPTETFLCSLARHKNEALLQEFLERISRGLNCPGARGIQGNNHTLPNRAGPAQGFATYDCTNYEFLSLRVALNYVYTADCINES